MQPAQRNLFHDEIAENEAYLKTQLITYIGNKRSLLPFIETAILHTKKQLGRNKVSFADLFSGSGVVSRLARQHSHTLHCNDLEDYSFIFNSCYQQNQSSIDPYLLREQITHAQELVHSSLHEGFITRLYSPKDELNIKPGERVFYTRRNAMFLDAFCSILQTFDSEIRPLLLAPILAQASMYTNTSGVFKGFYKNKEGIGQYGGTAENALTRIRRDIKVLEPIFSNFDCQLSLYNEDSNTLVQRIPDVDVAYFDPPYNQHPYGSNYFMLNLLCDYVEPKDVSPVSGIPTDWKRSAYNKPKQAAKALFDAVANIRAKFVLISYNSEGFIGHETFLDELIRLGEVSVMDSKYNTFRGCRNLSGRDIHVTEFLYLLDKR